MARINEGWVITASKGHGPWFSCMTQVGLHENSCTSINYFAKCAFRISPAQLPGQRTQLAPHELVFDPTSMLAAKIEYRLGLSGRPGRLPSLMRPMRAIFQASAVVRIVLLRHKGFRLSTSMVSRILGDLKRRGVLIGARSLATAQTQRSKMRGRFGLAENHVFGPFGGLAIWCNSRYQMTTTPALSGPETLLGARYGFALGRPGSSRTPLRSLLYDPEKGLRH